MGETRFYEAVDRMPQLFDQLMRCEPLEMKAKAEWKGIHAIYVFYDGDGNASPKADGARASRAEGLSKSPRPQSIAGGGIRHGARNPAIGDGAIGIGFRHAKN